MDIQKEAFESNFKKTEIYRRECAIRGKDILEFSKTMGGYFNIVANDAWNMWQESKAQAVPKWISVEEALPPGNILVLAMAQTFSNVFNVYNVMALDEFQESDITHWMPLPDVPQEPTND